MVHVPYVQPPRASHAMAHAMVLINSNPHTMDFQPSVHQAAGHDGCLAAENIFAKASTPQEIQFYSETIARIPDDDVISQGNHISHWMPTFMGTLRLGCRQEEGATTMVADSIEEIQKKASFTPADDKEYIVLSNLYYGYKQPNILDIKLGAELCDENVSDEKRRRLDEVSRTTTLGSLNFRICGMRLYEGNSVNSGNSDISGNSEDPYKTVDDSGYAQYNKFYGRSLTKENIGTAFWKFFEPAENPTIRKLLVERFLQRLQLLYNCLLDTEIRVFSGSLLFVYESDPIAWKKVIEEPGLYAGFDPIIYEEEIDSDDDENNGDSDRKAPLSSLSMIDFAHARYAEGEGHDENIVLGVEKLMAIFEDMMKLS